MTGARFLLFLLMFCLTLAGARAQVEVRLQMGRKTFVAGESIPVSVSVTNYSGQDLVFQGNRQMGWLDFTVKSIGGTTLTPTAQPAFGSIKIPMGKTMSRTVDLSQLYPLQTVGNFTVYASVRLPGQAQDASLSNRVIFNLNSARPYWTQKFGVQGRPGQTREYRVLVHHGANKTALYAQLLDSRTGAALYTHSLGGVLMFQKPAVTMDRQQVMHILYLMAPDTWGHVRMTPDGKLLGRELHKRAAGSGPSLVNAPDGNVAVVNSRPYDPKAAAEARMRVRKASDRPGFIFN